MEELQSLGPFPIRAGVLRNDDIIRLGSELFCALCQRQNAIGANSELRFFELLQAVFYRVGISVDEKDAQGPASVGCRAIRTATPLIRLYFVLSKV